MATASAWDYAVHNPAGEFVAAVEVKARAETTPEWAARWRELQPDGPAFLLLVTPKRIFVWSGSRQTQRPFAPTLDLDAQQILGPFFQEAGLDPETVTPNAFELLIGIWLARMTERAQVLVPAQLQALGFVDAVQGGTAAAA